MPYGDTGIHGLSLSVDGQNVPGYGSTVEYGASVAFNVWASLASDAPQAGNLILTVDVVDAEGNLHTRQSQKAANPGECTIQCGNFYCQSSWVLDGNSHIEC